MSAPYLGDYVEDEVVHFIWSSNDGSGASITRATDGTVSVYKDNGTTQSVAGVTDTEDFDSLTGIHVCTIDTSADAFYATGANYTVVLSAATIDGQTVNAVLAHFSIQNRFETTMRGTDSAALASVCTEGRLAELDAGNLPTDIAAIPTTAMRGTDSAALASVCTEGRLAELDAGNLPTDVAAIPTTAMRGTDSAALASSWTPTRAALLDTLTTLAAETRDATVLGQIKKVISVVESQRLAHTHQVHGDVFYVDPTNGASHGSGARGGDADPYASVQDCHDNAVTDSNHDLIILRAGAAAGVTTLTEAVTLSKRYLLIRGPGRDFIWTRSGNGDTITITADGIELSGFQLETAATGSGHGIQITDADFLRVHNTWINATRGDGINILRGENCQIHNNFFTDTGQSGAGEGIDIKGTAGSSNNNVIRDNIFRDCAGDAIAIAGGTTNNTTIVDNIIEGSTGWGIDIGASSVDAVVCGNCLGNNSSGNINDGGTTTVSANNEQWAKHSIATEARLVELDAANIPADIDALPTAAQNATELLDQAAGVETSWTVRQAFRVMLGALAGKLSGAATVTNVIRNPEDGKDRITATVDADGNRTAVTYDKT